jgi:hypothetical protein
MGEAILKAQELREITGLSRDADIRRLLEGQGIACFDGKNGIWTTYELIQLAGKVKLGLVKRDESESLL